MLATAFNLCQGNRTATLGDKVAYLAAGSKDVAPATLPDEDIKTGSAQDGLE